MASESTDSLQTTTELNSSNSNSKLPGKMTKKKMTALGLGLMCFTCLWSFGNITNGFGYFGGTRVIIPWLCVFVLYFFPYVMMVGELGVTFKEKSGGVSSWIYETIGPKMAFFCGWIYWVVHMPYLSQKLNYVIVAGNWAIFENGSVSQYPVWAVQLCALGIFLICIFIATRGIKAINKVASVAGMASFIMSILFIIMIWTAPALTGTQLNTIEFKLENFIPQDWTFLLSLSVLIFAVGGCEKISPYVNQLNDPGKQFPRAMFLALAMVVFTAVLGTIALGMVFDSNNIPSDFLTNGQYVAFQKLGEYYGTVFTFEVSGQVVTINLFVILYSVSNAVAQIAVIIISIDAPLRIMLGNADKKFFPEGLLKTNKNGCYTRGILIVGIIVSILVLLPCIGINDVDSLVKWLIKLNSICMPLRYLAVFLAYIALKAHQERFVNNDYKFVKSKQMGIFWGCWCFAITSICIILGMYSTSPFELIMNICTPIILVGIGLIMPLLARRNKDLPAES